MAVARRVDAPQQRAHRCDDALWQRFGEFLNHHHRKKMSNDARAVIDATLTDHAKVSVDRAGDLRFVGQGFELVTPLPRGPYSKSSADALRKAFAEYRRIFGQVPPVGEIEIINVRVAVSAPVGRGALKVAGGKDSASTLKAAAKRSS
jgi:N-methylhydantoinase A